MAFKNEVTQQLNDHALRQRENELLAKHAPPQPQAAAPPLPSEQEQQDEDDEEEFWNQPGAISVMGPNYIDDDDIDTNHSSPDDPVTVVCVEQAQLVDTHTEQELVRQLQEQQSQLQRVQTQLSEFKRAQKTAVQAEPIPESSRFKGVSAREKRAMMILLGNSVSSLASGLSHTAPAMEDDHHGGCCIVS